MALLEATGNLHNRLQLQVLDKGMVFRSRVATPEQPRDHNSKVDRRVGCRDIGRRDAGCERTKRRFTVVSWLRSATEELLTFRLKKVCQVPPQFNSTSRDTARRCQAVTVRPTVI